MDSYGIFLPRNAFSSLLYWFFSVSSTACYIYIRGFPTIRSTKGKGKPFRVFIYAFFMPLFIGYGISLIIYYVLYALSTLSMAATGYIVILLLVMSLFYTVWFLINLYFINLNKRLNPILRKSVMIVSLVTSFVLLILSLCTLLIRA
jgi:hypothetical protein